MALCRRVSSIRTGGREAGVARAAHRDIAMLVVIGSCRRMHSSEMSVTAKKCQ